MSKKFKIPQVLRTGTKDIGDEAVIAAFQAADTLISLSPISISRQVRHERNNTR